MNDRLALGQLISALRAFNQLDTKMQVSTILTFLEVAAADLDKRDLSVRELEKRVGLSSGVASRNANYWGEGTKDMRGGRLFVTVNINKQDHRMRDLRMTERGHAFLRTVIGERHGKAAGIEVPS